MLASVVSEDSIHPEKDSNKVQDIEVQLEK